MKRERKQLTPEQIKKIKAKKNKLVDDKETINK